METSERRTAMLTLLCRRRYETIKNLADEFGVSERTVRRDVESLSLRAPVYTQAGRYGGGVYVAENYQMDRMYFRDSETAVLHKLLACAEQDIWCGLSSEETVVLKRLIANYTKPLATNIKGKRKT